MVRSIICLFALLVSSPLLLAEAETDPRIARALAIQNAMNEARGHLQANRAAEAVAALEAQILHIDGNESFLALMKEAYLTWWSELGRTNSSPDKVNHVRRQLRILDPGINFDELMAANHVEPAKPEVARPVVVKSKPVVEDPFQQTPLDRLPVGERKPPAKEKETVGAPAGWQVVQSGSFRVFHQQAKAKAEQIAQLAEQVRTATFEKWAGPVSDAWNPQCDVWLHATGAEYAKTTNQAATSPGHSAVGLKNGRIAHRRIDLRLDDTGMLESTLPREVAHVVLADLFPDQPLPRWADVGMAVASESTAEVSRFLRAAPKLAQDKKLFAVHDLLGMADFPEAAKITPFYVESVSLVDYLVRLKGAKAFVLYLREAPRRGYEEALQRHYGIKDAAELQERWLKFALKGE